MSAASRRRGNQNKSLVGFLIADVHYAIDIARVREIINPLPMVPLMHVPPSVLGVADHRGEVLPVVDVRQRFGLPPLDDPRRTKWIIVNQEPHLVGLVVDGVTDVFGPSEPEQRGVPRLGVGDRERGVTAVFAYAGALVFVIDVDLLSAPTAELQLPRPEVSEWALRESSGS